jgi:hypothetical protein
MILVRVRPMFMPHVRFVPNRDSHVHLRKRAVSTSLALLLTGIVGCANGDGREMRTAPAIDPKPAEVEDAGMQCDKFDDDYRAEFNACEVDDDCEAVAVEFGCRAQLGVYGVATADRAEFDRCLPKAESLRACKSAPPPMRAEDGRVAAPDLFGVHPRCTSGRCRARIEEQHCGPTDKVCANRQLCISFLDAMGVTQYECLDNPCGDKPLECTCAEPVCSAPADQLRACAVELVETSDVFCKTISR